MQPQDAYPGGAFPKINPCVCRTNAYQYTAFAYEQKCTVLNDLCACGRWGRAENEVWFGGVTCGDIQFERMGAVEFRAIKVDFLDISLFCYLLACLFAWPVIECLQLGSVQLLVSWISMSQNPTIEESSSSHTEIHAPHLEALQPIILFTKCPYPSAGSESILKKLSNGFPSGILISDFSRFRHLSFRLTKRPCLTKRVDSGDASAP